MSVQAFTCKYKTFTFNYNVQLKYGTKLGKPRTIPIWQYYCPTAIGSKLSYLDDVEMMIQLRIGSATQYLFTGTGCYINSLTLILLQFHLHQKGLKGLEHLTSTWWKLVMFNCPSTTLFVNVPPINLLIIPPISKKILISDDYIKLEFSVSGSIGLFSFDFIWDTVTIVSRHLTGLLPFW